MSWLPTAVISAISVSFFVRYLRRMRKGDDELPSIWWQVAGVGFTMTLLLAYLFLDSKI